MKNKIIKCFYHLISNIWIPICNLIARIQVKSMGSGCKFHKICRMTQKTVIGNNCHFNGVTILGKGNVNIGDNFHSGKGLFIISSDHNFNFGSKLPYDDTYISKDVNIGDNVWVGINVIILKGVTLGDGCIIQAGSVVSKDIPMCAIAGGNPCKVFSERDIEHYKKLTGE